jgi:hypothetical protein
MSNTVLDLDCVKGETFLLSLELADAGVPFNLTGYVVYFTVVEQFGMTPVIDVLSSTGGQTTIVVDNAGGKIDITLTYQETKFEFTKGHYSVLIKSSTTVTALLNGALTVIPVAKVIT